VAVQTAHAAIRHRAGETVATYGFTVSSAISSAVLTIYAGPFVALSFTTAGGTLTASYAGGTTTLAPIFSPATSATLARGTYRYTLEATFPDATVETSHEGPWIVEP
jgi:hypothetical protein